MIEALFRGHSRRKFHELADIAAGKRRGKQAPPVSPLATGAVRQRRRVPPQLRHQRLDRGMPEHDHRHHRPHRVAIAPRLRCAFRFNRNRLRSGN
ncbi:MAG: hypothetical protein OXU19_08515 [bacterium]|nr:hypothetical protein [bacterium]MDE0360744.1 hypothetical protein [Rhodospirillaceae bacterium]